MGGWGDRARRPPQSGDRGTELIPNPIRIPPVCRGIAVQCSLRGIGFESGLCDSDLV
jgi:hypothetical protein